MEDNILNKSLATSPTLPDLITIHLGTNDCNGGVKPAVMVDRMNSLLGHILAATPKTQVFLADVVHTGNAWNDCVVSYNKLVPDIVTAWRAKGMKLFFVPMAARAGLCGDDGLEHDLCGGHQIHPTSAGYPRMASAFALSILQNFTL
jgi:lysophospholipase L1-like esterase